VSELDGDQKQEAKVRQSPSSKIVHEAIMQEGGFKGQA
jgi:hypothetical protein